MNNKTSPLNLTIFKICTCKKYCIGIWQIFSDVYDTWQKISPLFIRLSLVNLWSVEISCNFNSKTEIDILDIPEILRFYYSYEFNEVLCIVHLEAFQDVKKFLAQEP